MSAVRQREVGLVKRQKMVKVSVEVLSGAALFRVTGQAESIRRALGMVGARYPQGEVAVLFPIEPEGFFVKDSAATAGMVRPEQTNKEAARASRREEAIGWVR